MYQFRSFVFRHRRRKAELPVVVLVSRQGEQLRIFGHSVEISETGLLAVLDGSLFDEEQVELHVHATGASEPLRVRAIAQFRDAERYSFRFLHIENEAVIPSSVKWKLFYS